MDPLAHTLVGATLAETGLRRRSPLATATLVLGANAPDLDATVGFWGTDAQLGLRRGLTHGVVSMALLPLALVAVVWLFDVLVRRRRDPDAAPARLRALVPLAYLSVLSHPLLDWLNTYGVRLLMPFDGRWFYGDAVFIVDPWIWLLAAAAAVLARSASRPGQVAWLVLGLATTALVTGVDLVPVPAKVLWLAGVGAIFAGRLRGAHPRAAERVARACALSLCLYVGLMVWGSSIAADGASEWLGDKGTRFERVMAGPIAASPFEREVVVVTRQRYEFLRVRLLPVLQVEEAGPPIDRGSADATVRAALRHVPGFAGWLRFPAYAVAADEGGHRVRVWDVRYARDEGASFGAVEILLDGDLALREPPRFTSRH